MSTSDHAETNGQSKAAKKTLSGMLKNIVRTSPTEWDKYLPEMEFEYNSSKHESTGLIPYEVEIERIPTRSITRELKKRKTNG